MGGSRRGVVAAAVLVPVLALTGCHYGRGMTFREVVVHFAPAAPERAHLAARAACVGAAPQTSPEPLPSGRVPTSTRELDVRFRVDGASDYDLQQLYSCLMRQPGVVGVDLPDLSQ